MNILLEPLHEYLGRGRRSLHLFDIEKVRQHIHLPIPLLIAIPLKLVMHRNP
jgi:hypothetical protein